MKPSVGEETQNVKTQDLLKFLIPSIFGVYMFLVPVPHGDTFTITIGIVFDYLNQKFINILPYVIACITVFAAIMSTWAYFAKPKSIMENDRLKKTFHVTPLYLVSRILGAFFTILVAFNIGPEFITSGNTGGTMIGLANTLICIFITISYLMTFLTDFGVMEFTGILIKNIVRPLFTVPGRSAVDLVTSWLGASNAACILTKRQYDTGFYSKREAAVIMTNFSIVSVPFCLIVATIIGGLDKLFTQFYLSIFVVGMIIAAITPRIPPLSRIPNTYNPTTGKLVDETVPEGYSKLNWALRLAVNRARKNELNQFFSTGTDMLFNLSFGLIPVVMAWGTIALIIVEYTPFFRWISYPMGLYLQLLGLEEAAQAAPATLVGFVDMFIPPVMLAGIESMKTKFVVGAASLLQIIYLTETGAIILQSDISVSFKDLFIMFLERTLIALALLAIIASIIF
jgi:nucleoside recognition membrane protein YjiH